MVFVSPRSKALDLCAADNDCGADVLVPRILTLLTWVQRDHPKKTNVAMENGPKMMSLAVKRILTCSVFVPWKITIFKSRYIFYMVVCPLSC